MGRVKTGKQNRYTRTCHPTVLLVAVRSDSKYRVHPSSVSGRRVQHPGHGASRQDQERAERGRSERQYKFLEEREKQAPLGIHTQSREGRERRATFDRSRADTENRVPCQRPTRRRGHRIGCEASGNRPAVRGRGWSRRRTTRPRIYNGVPGIG